jgi:hypothetical protein
MRCVSESIGVDSGQFRKPVECVVKIMPCMLDRLGSLASYIHAPES